MMRLPAFDYRVPREVGEAVSLLAEYGEDAKVLAGGTDLLPSMKQGLFTPKVLVSLRGMAELRGIRDAEGGGLRVGAATTLRDVARDPRVLALYPALADACSTVATHIIQGTGTLGGNVLLDTRCTYYNQSAFWRTALGFCLKKGGDVCHVARTSPTCMATASADTVPALILMGAKARLVGAAGERVVPVESLYTDDGRDWNTLRQGELLTEVLLPPPAPGSAILHRKMRRRQAIDYGFLLAAVRVDGDVAGGLTDARVVVSCVGPRPVVTPLGDLVAGRPLTAELAEEIAHAAARPAAPLTTHGVMPSYRKKMIRVTVRRALDTLRGAPEPSAAV